LKSLGIYSVFFFLLFSEAYWNNFTSGRGLVNDTISFHFLASNYKLSIKLTVTLILFASFSMFPKSTHETFSTKLFRSLNTHSRLQKEKFSETDFTISHYAGKVPPTYQLFDHKHDVNKVIMCSHTFIIFFYCFTGNLSNGFIFG